MLDYKLIEALAAVLDQGSFEKAARQLFITQSATSQRVKLLEERMGQALVVRSAPVRSTEAGRMLLRHFRQVLQLENDLRDTLQMQAAPFVTLPLALNSDSLALWFIKAMTPLLRAEGLLLDLHVDDQERTHDLLRNGEVLGCLSARSAPMQGCKCIYLGRMDYYCLATPEFAQRWFPRGLTREAAEQAPAVLFNRRDELHDQFLANHMQPPPLGYPRHYCPSTEHFHTLIVEGLAYGLSPHQQALPDLERGALVEIAPGAVERVPLYWRHWNLKGGLVERLAVHLENQGKNLLLP